MHLCLITAKQSLQQYCFGSRYIYRQRLATPHTSFPDLHLVLTLQFYLANYAFAKRSCIFCFFQQSKDMQIRSELLPVYVNHVIAW